MAEVQSTKEEPLFANCVFAFPIKADLEASRDSKGRDLRHTLEEHGGKVQPIKSDGLLNLEEVTHIISSTSDFPQYDTARLQMIAVVRSDWVIQSLMKSRMVQTRPFTPDTRLFFSGVNLSCGDIPPGDKEAIIGAVLAMGGMEGSNVTKLTTHVCALSMDHPKCQSVKDKNLKCKIVLPHWFDDCLKLGKAIDSAPYELPNPEIFEKRPEDALPFPLSPNVEGATTPHPDENSLMVPVIPSTRRLSVFKSKTVKISEDLELTERHVRVLGELIRSGGGTTTNSVHEADMYICKYRDGRDYIFASRAQIDVGNLSWLYFLIANNHWTSPLRRLLHYPLPRNGIPGFEDLRITLSNYGGEARTYVENLVIAAGGEFTKSMKQNNTHLITARRNSEKCTAAEEWNIAIINHLWIEESYAKCELQALTVSRYTHFPPRTNLGEIIGQTQFDADVLESIYYPKDPTPEPDDPKTLRLPRKNDAAVPITLDGQGDQDDETMVDAEDLPPPKKAARTPGPRRKSKGPLAETHSSSTTPSSNRRTSLGKENDTPSSTRSAKASALNRLHDLKDDVALYELERKRPGKGVWGGKRAANQIEKEKTVKATQQRSSSPAEMDVDDESEEEAPAMKRAKTGRGVPKSLPEIQIRVLLTGYKRWLENIKKEEGEKKKLRQLGIHVVSDPLNCTHLAAPAVVRTKKFLCALATGPTIVTSDFVDKCIDDGEIPPIAEFLLRDSEHEKKTKMKLKDILTRAKANRRHLLHNIPVYCTEHVGKELPETYQAIVKVNGGIFSIFRGRGGMKLKPTKPEEDSNPGPDPVYLISGLKPIERQLWPKFEEMANAAHMDPRIVTADWLLDTAISQQLTWDEKYRLKG